MQNIIAVIWDFDKTLVDSYMQDPNFNEYGINASDFWKEVNELPQKYQAEGVKVNKDTIYLNQFIRYTQEGKFKGLNNEKLKGYGILQKFYPGIPEIFKTTSELLKDDKINDRIRQERDNPADQENNRRDTLSKFKAVGPVG